MLAIDKGSAKRKQIQGLLFLKMYKFIMPSEDGIEMKFIQ